MSSELFKKIAERMKRLDRFFQQRRSASGELGHNTYQKVIAAAEANGMDSFKDTRRIPPSFLRPWPIKSMPGSCNDINVLQRSPLFAKLANGEAPPMEFQANNHTYKIDYYLADGIYPRWTTFMKPIVAPTGKKEVQY
jgi:hypothetical protein